MLKSCPYFWPDMRWTTGASILSCLSAAVSIGSLWVDGLDVLLWFRSASVKCVFSPLIGAIARLSPQAQILQVLATGRLDLVAGVLCRLS